MLRWLFNISAAVSLLLCVATLVMSVRSVSMMDSFGYVTKQGDLIAFATAGGDLCVAQLDDAGALFNDGGWVYHPHERTTLDSYHVVNRRGWLSSTRFELLGFQVFHADATPVRLGFLYLIVPLWMFVVLTAVLPLVWILTAPAARRRRRKRKGLCPACGYDLRGGTGACPECGDDSGGSSHAKAIATIDAGT